MACIDPLRNFRYRLEIDSVTQAGFSEVTIAEKTIDSVDYREGTDPPHIRTRSGPTKYGNVTLRRGLAVGGTALGLSKWHNDVSAGLLKDERKKVAILVQDEVGADWARFVVNDAWPLKYEPSDMNAKGNEVIIELLELANEGIERVS
jgi:phage tail-like protein